MKSYLRVISKWWGRDELIGSIGVERGGRRDGERLTALDHDEVVANRPYDEDSVQGYIVSGFEDAEEVTAWNV